MAQLIGVRKEHFVYLQTNVFMKRVCICMLPHVLIQVEIVKHFLSYPEFGPGGPTSKYSDSHVWTGDLSYAGCTENSTKTLEQNEQNTSSVPLLERT